MDVTNIGSLFTEESVSLDRLKELVQKIEAALGDTELAESTKLYIDNLYDMVNDYIRGYYTDIDLKSLVIVTAGIVYLVMPSDISEEIFGKKTLFKGALTVGICIALIESEMKKYRLFLSENVVEVRNEYGLIKYYSHRG